MTRLSPQIPAQAAVLDASAGRPRDNLIISLVLGAGLRLGEFVRRSVCGWLVLLIAALVTPAFADLEPTHSIEFRDGILAHAFVPGYFLVQSARTINAYRYSRGGILEVTPSGKYRTDQPLRLSLENIKLLSIPARLELPRLDAAISGQLLAAAIGDGQTHLFLLRSDRGTFEQVAAFKLSEETKWTWPVACHAESRRFLVMGCDEEETTMWGIERIDLSGGVTETQSPLDTEDIFLCSNCRGTGEFAADGSKILITQVSTPNEKGTESMSQIYFSENDELDPYPWVAYNTSSTLRKDGDLVLSVSPSGNKTFVTTALEVNGGFGAKTTAFLPEGLSFEGFSLDGRYAIFKDRTHSLVSYSVPVDARNGVVGKHQFRNGRFRQLLSNLATWIEVKAASVDIVRVDSNGHFTTESRALIDTDGVLEFVDRVDMSPLGNYLAVRTPDLKVSVVLKLDKEEARPLLIPAQPKMFIGFSPDEKWVMLGDGEVGYLSSVVPRQIEFFKLQ